MAAASQDIRTQERNVYLTVVGTAPSVDAVDEAGRGSKRTAVFSCTVNGQAVVALVRIEEARGATYLDLVLAEGLAEAETAVEAMNLATARPGHPTPVDDAVDASAIAVAGA